MKLSDIVIKEDAPEGDKPIELKDIVKYFPNTYKKAVSTLVKSGRLAFGGHPLFKKGGEYTSELEDMIDTAKQHVMDEEISLRIEIDGSHAGKDDGGDYDIDIKPDDVNEVYVGFSPRGDKLLIGFDCWVSENDFNDSWDSEFEKIFGEDFDSDNPDHEKIFNAAWKTFRDEQSFFGILVEVNEHGDPHIDDMPGEGGFYKGLYNNKSRMARDNIIDFRLD